MTLQLGSAEAFKDTSATDEVSLPYIDDISPHELKAAEVMVKEEVRHFFSPRLFAFVRSFDRSIDLVLRPRFYRERSSAIQTNATLTVGHSFLENRCAGCRNAKTTTWLMYRLRPLLDSKKTNI